MSEPGNQLSMLDEADHRRRTLDKAIDRILLKYGFDAIETAGYSPSGTLDVNGRSTFLPPAQYRPGALGRSLSFESEVGKKEKHRP